MRNHDTLTALTELNVRAWLFRTKRKGIRACSSDLACAQAYQEQKNVEEPSS